ncbi:unnamed protein product [Phytophthora fragariaefolia]|uniref:Unnamed protein product n=1 Tax=Phytophthora fragariaefolia TaxID=1490495 RepID=A0A9W7D6W8_9STRA|nr:unnamed protein product [Phytophthora fragariaefolia]
MAKDIALDLREESSAAADVGHDDDGNILEIGGETRIDSPITTAFCASLIIEYRVNVPCPTCSTLSGLPILLRIRNDRIGGTSILFISHFSSTFVKVNIQRAC